MLREYISHCPQNNGGWSQHTLALIPLTEEYSLGSAGSTRARCAYGPASKHSHGGVASARKQWDTAMDTLAGRLHSSHIAYVLCIPLTAHRLTNTIGPEQRTACIGYAYPINQPGAPRLGKYHVSYRHIVGLDTATWPFATGRSVGSSRTLSSCTIMSR